MKKGVKIPRGKNREYNNVPWHQARALRRKVNSLLRGEKDGISTDVNLFGINNDLIITTEGDPTSDDLHKIAGAIPVLDNTRKACGFDGSLKLHPDLYFKLREIELNDDLRKGIESIGIFLTS